MKASYLSKQWVDNDKESVWWGGEYQAARVGGQQWQATRLGGRQQQ